MRPMGGRSAAWAGEWNPTSREVGFCQQVQKTSALTPPPQQPRQILPTLLPPPPTTTPLLLLLLPSSLCSQTQVCFCNYRPCCCSCHKQHKRFLRGKNYKTFVCCFSIIFVSVLGGRKGKHLGGCWLPLWWAGESSCLCRPWLCSSSSSRCRSHDD